MASTENDATSWARRRRRRFCLRCSAHRQVTRRVASWLLSHRMKRRKKRYESRRFRRTEILPICRHVPSALNHLPDELICRESRRDEVERRSSLAACVAQRVAVPALLFLKDERASPLDRGTTR